MEIFGWAAKIPHGPGEWLPVVAVLVLAVSSVWLAGGVGPGLFAVVVASIGYSFDRHLYIPVAIAVAGIGGVTAGRRVIAPRPVRRVAREALFIGGGFMLYEWLRTITEGERDVAIANGLRVFHLEQGLRLWVEPHLQAWVLADIDRVRLFSELYSRSFIAITVGTLFFLLVSDEANYRIYRSCLGISALLAIGIIWRSPTAPPRLIPETGMIDTHAILGRGHGFVNEFAAVPSLHVGWMALASFVLFRSLKSRWRWVFGLLPWSMMLFTVIVTGNHFWFDGLVGATIAVGPAIILARRSPMFDAAVEPWPQALARAATWPGRLARAATATHKMTFTSVTLGTLLGYLLVRETIDSGFTNYWGYMVAQLAITLGLAMMLESTFAAYGGLSWHTHIILAVVSWADTLGTAGHMYENYREYDKITHFLGIALMVAATADALGLLAAHGTLPWRLSTRLKIALMAGIFVGAGWEVYEVLGDRVFDTGRWQGMTDTAFDLIFDTLGGVMVVGYLWWRSERGPVAGTDFEAALADPEPDAQPAADD